MTISPTRGVPGTPDVPAGSVPPVRRDRRGERRAAGRRPAVRAPELASFALDELRAYRQELIVEESRVSYWRRLLHARLDLAADDTRSLGRVREVLDEHQAASRRLALTPLADPEQLPPLPDLPALWDADRGSDDTDLILRLAAAERELSAYRRALHERLDAATGELISRYRDEPTLALRALPLQRPKPSLSA